MPRHFPFGRRERVGVALSATGLHVVWKEGASIRVFQASVAAYPGDNGAWPGLTATLNDLRRAVGVARGGRLAVALLPPLVEVRRLLLPPLRDAEVTQLLTRNSGRYFVNARGPQVVGALGRPDGAGPVLAAAASVRLLSALHHAAGEAGWTVASVTPADAAWGAAATALWPTFARGPSQLLVHEKDRTALVELRGGQVANVRRFRGGAADAELAAEAIVQAVVDGTSATVGAIGTSGQAELRRALMSSVVVVTVVAGAWAAHAASPEVMAAAFAARSAGPWLTTEAERGRSRARVARATGVVAAVALLLIVAAAGIVMWGARRDLRAVRAERAAIRSQVAATLVGRTSVEDAYGRVAALATAERNAPQWAPVLAALSARVPDDAYLTAVHVHGDSLVVDGLATSASRVFDAIEQSPELEDVRAPAPVRREAQENSPPMERFTIAAQLHDRAGGHRPPVPAVRVADPPRGQQ